MADECLQQNEELILKDSRCLQILELDKPLDLKNLEDCSSACRKFARRIESNLYSEMEEHVSQVYIKRFMELDSGLKHELNEALRLKLFRGITNVEQFVKLT